MELYSPQVQIVVGGYAFTKGVELEVSSSVDSCYDWAKIKFVSPMEQKLSISKRSPALVRVGYNGNFQTVFTGYALNDFTTGQNGNEILFKDAMLLLSNVTVNNTFVQATPQEIVSYCANLAGISKVELDTTPYPPIARLPIFSQNGIRAIRSLGGYWGIAPDFFVQDDTLYWGTKAEQKKIYAFKYAENIISLRLTGGLWELQTVAVPFIRHSQKIRVVHPLLRGDFTVLRIRMTTSYKGFIRTTLYFEGA